MGSSYTYNVVPQARSPKPLQPTNCIKCPPDNSIQAIIFDDTSLCVVKGWETRSSTDLREFFHPIDSYLEYQITLKSMMPDQSVTLNYGIDGSGESTVFLAILPLWHLSDVDYENIGINWRYKGYKIFTDMNSNDVPDSLEPYGVENDSYLELDYDWDILSRILILSGTKEKPIRPIELQNVTTDDVMLKILIGKLNI